jgi:hypothetical protein
MVSLDAPKTPQLLCSPVLPPRTDRPPLLTARNSTVFLELPSQGGLPPLAPPRENQSEKHCSKSACRRLHVNTVCIQRRYAHA